MTHDQEREFWIRRVEATGRAQSRYLWILLVTGLFYAALQSRGTPVQTITVPIVELQLDTLSVLSSGGPIIAFLILVVIGAIRAWSHALEQVRGTKPAEGVEQLDTHPNAIDLAIYTTANSPSFLRNLLYFAYPLFLLAALIESGLLGWWVMHTPMVPGRALVIAAQALTWLPAAWLVLSMWVGRFKRVR
jgi:hypothetical protein